MKRIMPTATAAVLMWAAVGAPAAEDSWPAGLDSNALNTIAVAHDGRLMILDTRARHLLSKICGREQLDGIAPAATVIDLIARPEARQRPLIYVNYLPLKQRLLAHLPADRREPLLPRKVLLAPADILRDELPAVLDDTFRSGDEKMPGALLELREALELLDPQRLLDELVIVPPVADATDDRWTSPADPAATGVMDGLLDAFRNKDAAAVDAAAAALTEHLKYRNPSVSYPHQDLRNLELFYNRSGKLTPVVAAYVVAAVLLLAWGLFARKPLGVLGQIALTAALLMHAGLLTVRGLIAGYLPLTNVYESLLLAAWIVALAAWVIQRLKRARELPRWAIGAAGASLAALLCLLPNFVGIGQGHIGARNPLLRSAWLTYHVITIMTGYAFILLSFVVSVLYLLMRTRRPAKGLLPIDRANLILVRLAFLFVLAGILTGSVWADVAWGRWWGWDAKETMSLVTLLVYTVLLHVRLFAKDKALATAVLSIVGVLSMAMTWFGVTYLIRGSLHSYV